MSPVDIWIIANWAGSRWYVLCIVNVFRTTSQYGTIQEIGAYDAHCRCIWRPEVVDKLNWKHGVDAEEVDQVLFGAAQFRKLQRGHIPDEHVYAAFGRTERGRYLTVIFIYKVTREAMILTARDMDNSERKAYERR